MPFSPAPFPKNETERLAALQSYDVLDTFPEEAYDDITLLASSLCKTPISLISFVDEKRQWFKSKIGITVDETPRDVAFCAHAVLTSALFEIVDAQTDERFSDHPFVLENPKICFYAGAPLVDSEGFALGTLCVIDTEPRTLNMDQRHVLEALARQIVSQLQLRKNTRELQRQNQKMKELFELKEISLFELEVHRKALFYCSKMAILGTMSAGIAHEINNPLAILSGRVQQIKDQVNRGTEKK